MKAQSRRSFMTTSILAGGGLLLSFRGFSQLGKESFSTSSQIELAGYIQISSDNRITLLCPNPEFGQNVMTSLPMILAEELEVDWETIRVEMGPHDAVKLGPQFTGGSNSVRMYWKPLREAGASALHVLKLAASQSWGVPISEIIAKKGELFHHSGKKATFGAFAEGAAHLPLPKQTSLKKAKDFSIIRQSKKNVEGQKIVTGKPLFGLDYHVEGMQIAMAEHPPAFGFKLKSFNASEVLKMPGITHVFPIKLYSSDVEQGGFDTRTFNEVIAIVGKTTWEVLNARKKLKVEWEPAGDNQEMVNFRGNKRLVSIPGRLETSSDQLKLLMSHPNKQVLRQDGEPEKAFQEAALILERTYHAPFLAHNCMEPMNFFAHVQDDKALLAGPLQAPGWAEPTLAKIIGLPPEKIEIQMTRMGGGFGRRAYAQYMYEAALISQKLKAPIKLVYTREDDMTYGIYRPMYTATYRAALDENKNLIGFHVIGGGFPENPLHANRFPAGAVDNYLAEGFEIPTNVTIGAFRAPRSNFNAAAEQSFLDELAETMGKDPMQLRFDLLLRAKANLVGKTNDYDPDRYLGVLQLLKEKSGWGKAEHQGKNRGLAAYFCHNSYAGHVVDMSIRDGQPYVEHVTSVVDCGVIINPDAARNMVQGAVVDGIGQSFFGELTLESGVPQQSNFHNYRMIRHAEAPKKIDVYFVENDIDPTGLGEPPFPPIFGAVANALYKTKGKRFYQQPFLGEQNQEKS